MIKRLLNKSDFLKNVATLITGTIIAQLIPLLLRPVLSRIYSEEEFGTFTIYLSIIGVLGSVGNLKYEGAIVLPNSDKKASALVIGSLFVSLIFSVFWLLTFYIFENSITEVYPNITKIKFWGLIIPLSIFIISSNRVLNYWLIRQKAFRAASINKLARRSSEGTAHFSLAYTPKLQGLIIGSFIGEFINLVVSYRQSLKAKLSIRNVSKIEIKSQLLKYKEFPLFAFIPSLLDTLSLFLPILVISMMFDLKTTGQVGFSQQMLSIPLALISVSIGQVLVQKVAESNRAKKNITSLILKISLALTSISILGILIMELFGVQLFMFVFGDNWEFAGEISKILVFTYAVKFIVSPLTSIFTSLNKIKISSVWQVGYFFTILISLYFIKDLPIKEFLTSYVIIDLIAFSIYYFILIGVCINNDKKMTDD